MILVTVDIFTNKVISAREAPDPGAPPDENAAQQAMTEDQVEVLIGDMSLDDLNALFNPAAGEPVDLFYSGGDFSTAPTAEPPSPLEQLAAQIEDTRTALGKSTTDPVTWDELLQASGG